MLDSTFEVEEKMYKMGAKKIISDDIKVKIDSLDYFLYQVEKTEKIVQNIKIKLKNEKSELEELLKKIKQEPPIMQAREEIVEIC